MTQTARAMFDTVSSSCCLVQLFGWGEKEDTPSQLPSAKWYKTERMVITETIFKGTPGQPWKNHQSVVTFS